MNSTSSTFDPPLSSKFVIFPSQSVSFYYIYDVVCHFKSCLDVPLDDLVANPGKYLPENNTVHTYVLCRLGNDSQTAVEALRRFDRNTGTNEMLIKDIIGGLRAWTREVDPGFPEY